MAVAQKIWTFSLPWVEDLAAKEHDERLTSHKRDQCSQRMMFAWETTCQPFSSEKSWRAKKSLELIHTDVCGPMRTPLHEQNNGCNIKTIRSGRGKGYTSNEFNKFCEDEGMEHQLTVGYVPEQNGVLERKNRTVMETTRAMLMEKSLLNTFWAEAVSTVVYLLNQCPAKSMQDKILLVFKDSSLVSLTTCSPGVFSLGAILSFAVIAPTGCSARNDENTRHTQYLRFPSRKGWELIAQSSNRVGYG
ncbi:uncharacterized protein LOC111412689 [Olea europaea var. sylvestris]|uniref:uncharacterized protein LOC111412689 n=1 Tax=Olea europaea var. sylvestris TaxID=158386 RepID=UPI000C1D42F1|nr:uncharacterized protein LOC111412689 [Olea europaea var. sylvestris]